MNHQEFFNKTLPNDAISDFKWVFDSFKIQFQISDLENVYEFMDYINLNSHNKILLWMQDEIPPNGNKNFLELLNLIELSNKDIKISVGTSTKFPYSVNPFINFYNFREIKMPIHAIPYIGLLNEPTDYVPRFPIDKYYLGKTINFESKTIKGILSNRKNSWWRNKFKEKINNNFDGIYRNLEFEQHENYTFQQSIQFPTWDELLEEYNSSLVSFIMETDHTITNDLQFKINPITEKTPLAFMNFCIPIIYGKSEFIKELNKLGFWIANNDFEFGIGDFCTDDGVRLEHFINCVYKFNSMSLKQIKSYYLTNLDKIQKNYDLMSSVISNEYVFENFGKMDKFVNNRRISNEKQEIKNII